MAKIKGYTRSDGIKVKGHNRTHKRKGKYTAAQQRAFDRSKTSKSGYKTWQERQKQSKPGLWANYHAKIARLKRRKAK